LSLLAEEPLASDWHPLSVVWEIAIREGMPLGSSVTRAMAGGKEVFTVKDDARNRTFYVCLESKVTADLASALELTPEDLLIVLDSALDDTAAANLALQCRLKAL
jgi:adenine-specific DNA-methyltransferase